MIQHQPTADWESHVLPLRIYMHMHAQVYMLNPGQSAENHRQITCRFVKLGHTHRLLHYLLHFRQNVRPHVSR